VIIKKNCKKSFRVSAHIPKV